MRELKFRSWILKKNKHEMVYSGDIRKEEYINFPFKADGKRIIDVMQYIGINDISGNEIYEGDIIARQNNSNSRVEKGVIEYKNGQYILRLSPDIYYEISVDAMFSSVVSKYKIIGNKYQNPILLFE